MISKLMKKIWNSLEKTIYFVLNFFCRITHKNLDEKNFEAFMQFVKFSVVGVSNTFISYVLYATSLLALKKWDIGGAYNYLLTQIVAFVLSVLWSFYWNNKMVFRTEQGKRRSIWRSLIKTYISYSFTGLFLSSILLVFWVNIAHVSEFVAPLLNLIISVPLNFFINKYWAFKEK